MADLPKPHKNWNEDPYGEMSGGSAAESRPRSERDRYASDTEVLNIPPELYEQKPAGMEDGYGLPDGYDPYDPYALPHDERAVRRSQQTRRSAAADYNEPRRRSASADYGESQPRRRSADPAARQQQRKRPPRARYYDAEPRRTTKPKASAKPKKVRRRHHSSCLGRLLRWLLGVLLTIFAMYSIAALRVISKLDKVGDAPRMVTTGTIGNSAYTRTVLLIGTDSRDLMQERGRSDSMILLTINDSTRETYMSSLMRDTYVDIPNYGYDKLNAAYAYGGAELLMDTIEQNYDVSVDDYVCVSFAGFAGIIDAFGGVEITLSEEEAKALNTILQSEVNSLMGDDPMSDFLPGGGTFLLTGKQALSYARIRYVGNADFERASRQREVMSQLLDNAKNHAFNALPDLLGSAKPHISTNMTTLELYLLSLHLPPAVLYDIRQQQIPADGTWSAANVGGQDVLQVDMAANRTVLQDTAYAAHHARTEETP